jgi:hypothetical protein
MMELLALILPLLIAQAGPSLSQDDTSVIQQDNAETYNHRAAWCTLRGPSRRGCGDLRNIYDDRFRVQLKKGGRWRYARGQSDDGLEIDTSGHSYNIGADLQATEEEHIESQDWHGAQTVRRGDDGDESADESERERELESRVRRLIGHPAMHQQQMLEQLRRARYGLVLRLRDDKEACERQIGDRERQLKELDQLIEKAESHSRT